MKKKIRVFKSQKNYYIMKKTLNRKSTFSVMNFTLQDLEKAGSQLDKLDKSGVLDEIAALDTLREGKVEPLTDREMEERKHKLGPVEPEQEEVPSTSRAAQLARELEEGTAIGQDEMAELNVEGWGLSYYQDPAYLIPDPHTSATEAALPGKKVEGKKPKETPSGFRVSRLMTADAAGQWAWFGRLFSYIQECEEANVPITIVTSKGGKKFSLKKTVDCRCKEGSPPHVQKRGNEVGKSAGQLAPSKLLAAQVAQVKSLEKPAPPPIEEVEEVLESENPRGQEDIPADLMNIFKRLTGGIVLKSLRLGLPDLRITAATPGFHPEELIETFGGLSEIPRDLSKLVVIVFKKKGTLKKMLTCYALKISK